jgi:uncharacterized membrane protein YfhO
VNVAEDSRNRVLADVEVPSGEHSALLTFSRPFFRGYRAELNGTNVKLDSYRGLMPTVEILPGTNGRLILTYRPGWLVWGSVIAGISLLVLLSPLLITRLVRRTNQ